jgi:hypothetical protein
LLIDEAAAVLGLCGTFRVAGFRAICSAAHVTNHLGRSELTGSSDDTARVIIDRAKFPGTPGRSRMERLIALSPAMVHEWIPEGPARVVIVPVCHNAESAKAAIAACMLQLHGSVEQRWQPDSGQGLHGATDAGMDQFARGERPL